MANATASQNVTSPLKQVRALARGVDMTPRKVSLVAGLVRGRTVADALVILSHTPKRAAKPVAKVIASAQANAVNTHGVDAKTLVIETLSVTAGPRLKRFKPASRGRALPFQKRTSHILVVVAGSEKEKKAANKTNAATANTAVADEQSKKGATV
jgi:large subunit ribosomal protein L22